MKAQNVVTFQAPELPHCWRQDELQQLVSLSSAHGTLSGNGSWGVGQTEAGDPQFYVIGKAPEFDCVLCVTRIGRLFVLEDGAGLVVAEDAHFDRIVKEASRMLAARKRLPFGARLLVGACAFRAVLDQKIEFMLAESMDHVSRIAPQLVAFV